MLDLALLARGQQIVIDLAGAHQNARDPRWIEPGCIVHDFMEAPGHQLIQHRNRAGMPQHAFGGEDDEWLADAAPIRTAVHLAAQHMEVLRGRAGVDHLHVVFGAQLQEALDAGAGMFGALSFIAVRQQKHQAAGLAPLGFGA